MALKIRLARGGAKKRPFYRIVVAEATSPRDGLFVERVGSYNPLLPAGHAERLVLKAERIQYWLSVGAQPTDRVAKFLGNEGLAPKPVYKDNPKKAALKKKAQERAKAETDAAEAAKAEKEAKKAAAAAEAAAPVEVAPVEEAPVEVAAPIEETAVAVEEPAETTEVAVEEAPSE